MAQSFADPFAAMGEEDLSTRLAMRTPDEREALAATSPRVRAVLDEQAAAVQDLQSMPDNEGWRAPAPVGIGATAQDVVGELAAAPASQQAPQKPKGPAVGSGGALGEMDRASESLAGIEGLESKAIEKTKGLREGDIALDAARKREELEHAALLGVADADYKGGLVAREQERNDEIQEMFEGKMADLDTAMQMRNTKAESPEQWRHLQSVVGSNFTTEAQKGRAREKMAELRKPPDVSGGKIAALIALSFLGRTKLGGIVDALNGMIQRDLDKQITSLERNKTAYTDMQKQWSGLMKATGDRNIANEGIHIQALEATKAALQSQFDKGMVDERVADQVRNDLMDLDEAIYKRKAKQHDRVAGNVLKLHENRSVIKREMAGRRFARETAMMTSGPGRTGDKLMVPGVGRAVSADAAKKAIQDKNGADTVLPAVARLLELRAKHGGGWSSKLGPENAQDAAEAESLAIQIQVGLRGPWGLGVLSESDKEMLAEVAGNPTSYSPFGGVDSRLESFMVKTVADTDAKFKNYGLPGYTMPTTGAAGRESLGITENPDG